MIDDVVPSKPTSWRTSLAIFAACFICALLLQTRMGAFRVERGLYSDDAAHFMNGLVIRDYVHQALGSNPVHFAEQYYLSYPKIAPLMWPPLFHVALGFWLLPGWPAATAALILIACCTAWAAWRLERMVRELVGPVGGMIAAVLFLTTPLVMEFSSVVMLDVVIAALAIESTHWLARFIRSGSSADACLYGLFTTLACLTKGNGVALVLVAPIAILITGRIDLLRRKGLYLAAAMVLILALPLLLVSVRLDAAIGDFSTPTLGAAAARLNYYSDQMWRNVGPLAVVLAGASAAATMIGGWRQQRGSLAVAQALIALTLAASLFHVFNPHTLALSRYMIMAIGPIIGLAFAGARMLAKAVGARPAVAMAIVTLVAVSSVSARATPKPRQTLGYRGIMNQLAAAGELSERRVLVVSDEVGEGAAVTEAAVMSLCPAPTIVRGSKLLASDNWMGDHFRLKYATPQALMQDLEALHVDYILLDRSRRSAQLPYFEQIQTLTKGAPGQLERISTPVQNAATGPARPLELYRVKLQPPGPSKPLEVTLSYSLGRALER